jgi:hypothetical protein
LLKVNPIHGKTRVRIDFMQSRDAKTCSNANPIRVSGIGMGIKRIVNRMGSEDLVVEIREKGCSRANRSLVSGVSKTKNITGGTDR